MESTQHEDPYNKFQRWENDALLERREKMRMALVDTAFLSRFSQILLSPVA